MKKTAFLLLLTITALSPSAFAVVNIDANSCGYLQASLDNRNYNPGHNNIITLPQGGKTTFFVPSALIGEDCKTNQELEDGEAYTAHVQWPGRKNPDGYWCNITITKN